MSSVRALGQAVAKVAYEDLEVPEMLDILYDIVATGVEPAQGGTVTQIEQFLHEHARAPRSREDFHAFFAEHDIQPPSQTEPRVPLRILQPLPQAAAPVTPVSDVASVHTTSDLLPAAALPVPTPMHVPHPEAADSAALSQRVIRHAALGLGLAAAALVVLGLWAMLSLRQDLSDARALATDTQRALEVQQAREASMARALGENRALIQHLEQQSDLLLDNLLPGPVVREQK